MATPIPFSLFSFILSNSLIIFLIFLFLNKSHALEGKEAVENNFHTIHISSGMPSTASCKPSPQGRSRKSSLKVVHRYGPCSQLRKNKNNIPTLSGVLSLDQSRVKWIQETALNSLSDSKAVNIPTKSGISLGTGNYIVTVGLGSPKQSLTLEFDTGSDLTWTQCRPCASETSCYTQQDPIFDPSASTTYSKCPSGPACSYMRRYKDKSFTEGNLGKDKLTLTPTEVFDNLIFGCGTNNSGLFGETAGLLGLSLGGLSIVSQSAQKYGKYFSYCLPKESGSNGHLTFGDSGVPSKNLDIQLSTWLPTLFCSVSSEYGEKGEAEAWSFEIPDSDEVEQEEGCSLCCFMLTRIEVYRRLYFAIQGVSVVFGALSISNFLLFFAIFFLTLSFSILF